MRREIPLGVRLAVMVVVQASVVMTVQAEDAESEARRMNGTWKFVSLRSDGQEAPADFLEKARWVILDKELTIPGSDGGKSSIKLNPGRSPKWFDLTGLEGPGKGKTAKAIYKFEEERLTICFPEGRNVTDATSRPGSFSGGAGRSLIVLERVTRAR